MTDKYSKIEEKVEEGKRRVLQIENCLLVALVLKDDLSKVLFWDIVDVKNDVNGTRLNVVEIRTKTSVTKFVLAREKENIEKKFQDTFLNNLNKKERLILRIG